MDDSYGRGYYIDLDAVAKKCEITPSQIGDGVPEINIFIYDIVKLCLERVLGEYGDEDDDDDLGKFREKTQSVSFKIALKTLIRYKIILEEDE